MALKDFNHYVLLRSDRYFKRTRMWGYPSFVHFEPINRCNLECPLCPLTTGRMDRETAVVSFADFKTVIDQLGPFTKTLQLVGIGEPTMNKELFEMIAYAKRRYSPIDITINTNGHFLNEMNVERMISSGLDVAIIAYDGLDADTFLTYRVGGDYDKLNQGIKRLVERRRTMGRRKPVVHLQLLLHRDAASQAEPFRRRAASLGVDIVRLKTLDVHYGIGERFDGSPDSTDLIPADVEHATRYRMEAGRLRLKRSVTTCDKPYLMTNINGDGSVTICDMDFNNWHPFGNVFTTPFREIWNGPAYVKYRDTMLRDFTALSMCAECTCPMTFESETDYEVHEELVDVPAEGGDWPGDKTIPVSRRSAL
ncbi:MAG: radical SAM protein [Vicinamibacterales bacterium]|jgi:MoaA/NifB/PqqE/SkfB family radical SAM enzyme|nr:radical SAM protein [Vicinamibacterales bacterium]